jgi:hypothetical protein
MEEAGRNFGRIFFQQGALADCDSIESCPKIHDGQNHNRIIFGVVLIEIFGAREILLDARNNHIGSIVVVYRCSDPRFQIPLHR